MTTHEVRVFEEAARKEEIVRQRNPLGPSLTIPRPPKSFPFVMQPTFGMSPLNVTPFGILDEALPRRAPGASVRRTEYAQQFDMERIKALAAEEREMLRICGLDAKGACMCHRSSNGEVGAAGCRPGGSIGPSVGHT
mmetsp:Transcript_5650/g.14745  ORF Transcript_5650/g.14745 Transcript_5650/m.14745 type:complete len:137 (-) Transcript_5650:45-455(-)